VERLETRGEKNMSNTESYTQHSSCVRDDHVTEQNMEKMSSSERSSVSTTQTLTWYKTVSYNVKEQSSVTH
jgi:hypothetical protein